MLYEPLIWARGTRGCGIEFFCSDEELIDWLLNVLPGDPGQYHLISVTPKHIIRREWETRRMHLPLSAAEEAVKMIPQWDDFWLYSEKLTPEIISKYELDHVTFDRFCGINGLISIQHGRKTKRNYSVKTEPLLRQEATLIGMVNKIWNTETGEGVEHVEYHKIFLALKKAIKKALVYSAIHRVGPNEDDVIEDDKSVMMTEGAYQLWQQGHPYWVRPGRRVEKKSRRKSK